MSVVAKGRKRVGVRNRLFVSEVVEKWVGGRAHRLFGGRQIRSRQL